METDPQNQSLCKPCLFTKKLRYVHNQILPFQSLLGITKSVMVIYYILSCSSAVLLDDKSSDSSLLKLRSQLPYAPKTSFLVSKFHIKAKLDIFT